MWMCRITRYVLAEFLKVFLAALTGMTVFVVLALVVQQAVRQGLGPQAVLKLIPFVLPLALLYAIPGTSLFAACSVFGRISDANEVTALKSLGISPLAFLRPAFYFAFATSLVVVWLNDYPAAWARVGVKRVVLESAEQIAYGMLRANRSFSTKQLSINVAAVDGHKLIRPTVSLYGSADEPPYEIRAREAEITTNFERDALIISFTDGEIEVSDKARVDFQGRTESIEIPLSAAAAKAGAIGGPSDIMSSQIPAEVTRWRGEIKSLEQRLAAEAAFHLMCGEFSDLTAKHWQGQQETLANFNASVARLHTEPWRRWANGFSCLAFVMVGAPLAIRLRNADVWTSFLLCFLPILVVYYPLLAYGVDMAKSGELPPCSVWIGNLVLFVVGWWMIRHVKRH